MHREREKSWVKHMEIKNYLSMSCLESCVCKLFCVQLFPESEICLYIFWASEKSGHNNSNKNDTDLQRPSYKSTTERKHQCLMIRESYLKPRDPRSQPQQYSPYCPDLCNSDHYGILAMNHLLVFLDLAQERLFSCRKRNSTLISISFFY